MKLRVAAGVVGLVVIVAAALVIEAQFLKESGPPDLRNGARPIGCLGYPLGTLVKIEGVQISEAFSHGLSTLNVDTVNGKKIGEKIEIWIEHEGFLETGKRYVMEGYETLSMSGTPPAQLEVARRKGQSVNMPQAVWGLNTYFVPLDGDMPTLEKPELPNPESSRSPFELESSPSARPRG